MYLCMCKKAVYSPTAEGQASVGPTVPAGPVYEEVSLREEIELKTNKAYLQVRLWTVYYNGCVYTCNVYVYTVYFNLFVQHFQ